MLLALQGASILADRVPSDNSLDVFRFNQWAQAALPFAIMQGRLPTIRKLLRRHDIDVNGRSPKAQPPILIALEYQQYEILRMLLSDPRLNIDIQDSRGYTALHLAVIYDDPVAVQILFDSTRIDVNHFVMFPDATLHTAAECLLDSRPRGRDSPAEAASQITASQLA
jgi:ankyrin repeat protein